MSTPRDKIEAKLGLAGPPLCQVRDAPPRVPDHELVRRIGQGAYGEVWLAHNALGTWRAVKIVYRENFKDARPYEREFAGIRRFEPLSRSNEGFVDVLQVGRDDAGGWFYYVMELADAVGEGDGRSQMEDREKEPSPTPVSSLPSSNSKLLSPSDYQPRTLSRDLHHRGRLPLEDCLQLGLTLTLALGHLHRHGLIHRDIKPSNIIFVGGVPKLADIGLVTEAAGANTFVGTEGFVPPEGPTSPQADLYALGKVLYEAAMGKDRNEFPEPFTQISTDRESIALMELNTILLRACAPDPKSRYASAEEMHADLALLHSGGSVKRRHQFDRQFRIAKQVGAVAIAATLLIGTAWLWQQQQTQKMTRLAKEKSTLATEKTTLADNLAKLGEENRQRIVRLDIANGVRLLDDNDPSAALLWFADALPLVTNNLAVVDIHRIRIQQTLDHAPRLLNMMNHEGVVSASAFSPDGLRLATATWIAGDDPTKLAVQDAQTGQVLWELSEQKDIQQLRFARDGRRWFVCSSANQGCGAFDTVSYHVRQLAEVLDVPTGKPVFPQLSSNLVCSAFSPDDRWLAVAFTNHVIQLLDTKNGQLVAEMKGHTNEITMLAFSGDGSVLVSSSRDFSARLWQLPSGEPLSPPFMDDQPIQQVALSGDGRHLATANWVRRDLNGTWWGADDPKASRVQVWDVQSAKRVGGTITQIGPTRALFFSPNGKALLTGSEAEGVRVWDIGADVKLQRTLTFSSLRCWEYDPDGVRLALGNDSGYVSIWSLETWGLLFPPFRHSGRVESVHFSPGRTRLVTSSDDGTAKVWSLDQRAETARLEMSANITPVPANDAHPRWRPANPMPVALLDNALHLIDVEKMTELEALRAQETNSTFINWIAALSGRYWAMTEHVGPPPGDIVALWSREGPRARRLSLPHPGCVIHLSFNADESRLVTFSRDWKIRVWRTSDGGLERTITVPSALWHLPQPIFPDAFSPDGNALMLGYGPPAPEDSQFHFFDFATGQFKGKPFVFSRIPGGIKRMRLSPDGTRFAAVGDDQKGSIVDLKTGDLAVPQFKHAGELLDLDWSPDGRRLITAGTSPEVKLWDATTGEMLLSPMTTTTTTTAAARTARWSADGRFIVTRSDDNQARVWDAATTEPVTPFLPHSGYIRWVCITPGNRLITASDPNLLRAWDLKPALLPVEVIADYAKLLSGRRLNAGGVLLPIPAKELAELAQSLRARAPELFE